MNFLPSALPVLVADPKQYCAAGTNLVKEDLVGSILFISHHIVCSNIFSNQRILY